MDLAHIEDLDLSKADDLATVEKQLLKDNQKYTIDSLKEDLAIPLPDAPKERGEVLSNRRQMLEALKGYERILNRRLPVLEDAPSREEIDAYEPEFLIEGWMPADRLTILTGKGGIGKSYLALQHIAGLAMGIKGYQLKQYHGTYEELFEKDSEAFTKESINIVIASYEEDLRETWKRIGWICDFIGWADYEKLKERIKFVDLKMCGPLWGVNEDIHTAIRSKLLDTGDWLLNEAKEAKARLLMLDPSAGAYGGSEIQREAVREFCSHLNGWGQEFGCATLLIAHPPKPRNNNDPEDDFSGSTDWLGSCRAMWTVRIEKENRGTKSKPEWVHWYQLTNVKQNYAGKCAPIPLCKIKSEEWGGYTPIWQKCDKEKAVSFFEDYNDTTPTRKETPTDESDEIADLVANS